MPRQRKQRLKKRKDGYYACRYKDQWFYSKISSDDAIAQREEYKNLERQQEIELLCGPKLKTYAERWLKNIETGAGLSTIRNNRIQIRKLTDSLGEKYICDIKASDIRSVFTEKYKDKSDDYIRHAASLYRRLFDAAEDDGFIKTNPARQKSAKPHKGTVGSHRAITDQERVLIENYCKDHRIYPAIMTMLYAGLRPQEIKAFDIDRSVDFEKNEIRLMDFVHMEDNTHYKVTEKGKTENATRTIPLFAPLRNILEGKHGLLVSTVTGKQVTTGAWRAAYRSYVYQMECIMNGMTPRKYKKIKTDKPEWMKFTVVPYDLRHSYCTWLRDNGVELKTCVLWMGHRDASMIMKIYDEAPDARLKSEAEKLNKKLIQSMNGSITKQQDSTTVEN